MNPLLEARLEKFHEDLANVGNFLRLIKEIKTDADLRAAMIQFERERGVPSAISDDLIININISGVYQLIAEAEFFAEVHRALRNLEKKTIAISPKDSNPNLILETFLLDTFVAFKKLDVQRNGAFASLVDFTAKLMRHD